MLWASDDLYFRDCLSAHPQAAKEYEALKLRLWRRFEHDRDAYTEAKTGFVKAVTAKAREECGLVLRSKRGTAQP